jgi:hypothetical protein
LRRLEDDKSLSEEEQQGLFDRALLLMSEGKKHEQLRGLLPQVAKGAAKKKGRAKAEEDMANQARKEREEALSNYQSVVRWGLAHSGSWGEGGLAHLPGIWEGGGMRAAGPRPAGMLAGRGVPLLACSAFDRGRYAPASTAGHEHALAACIGQSVPRFCCAPFPAAGGAIR